MNYYDLDKDFIEKTGVDYDFCACLEYNPQPFQLEDVVKVLAVYEGTTDETDWRWIIQLKYGKFAFVQGGCDYTGWDCQSWATTTFTDTLQEALNCALGENVVVTEKNTPANAGLGHLLKMLGGTYMSDNEFVYIKLIEQLNSVKAITWREKTDKEMGL